MRKTVSISISGLLFHAEEQAYRELDGYLSSIRSHFSSYEDRDEILADIENRIAERFTEKLGKSRKVLHEKDVAELIGSMGTVKDFEEFESESHAHQETNASGAGSKRLYRDGDNAMIAGVAAGIANYFGIDPTVARFIFLLTLIPGGTGILIYIVLWIVMPEAKTTTEKVEMRGQELTIKRIEALIRENIPEAAKKIKPGMIARAVEFPFKALRAILNGTGKFLRFLGPLIVRVTGLAILMAAIIGLFAVTFGFIMLLTNAWERYMDVPVRQIAGDGTYYTALISAYAVILITIIFAIGIGASMLRMRNDFRAPTVVVLVGLWFAALMAGAATIARNAPEIHVKIDQYIRAHDAAVTKNVQVGAFTSIEASGGYDIALKRGSIASVKVSGNELAVGGLQATVEDGILYIQRASRTRFCIICLGSRAAVEILTPSITNVAAHGGSELSVEDVEILGEIYAHGGSRVSVFASILPRNLHLESRGAGRINIDAVHPVDRLTIRSNGGSRVLFTGTATTANVEHYGASSVTLAGTGTSLHVEGHGGTRLNAEEFAVSDITIKLHGASRAHVNASRSIRGSVSGGSGLHYKGNPATVEVEEHGSGNVEMIRN